MRKKTKKKGATRPGVLLAPNYQSRVIKVNDHHIGDDTHEYLAMKV